MNAAALADMQRYKSLNTGLRVVGSLLQFASMMMSSATQKRRTYFESSLTASRFSTEMTLGAADVQS